MQTNGSLEDTLVSMFKQARYDKELREFPVAVHVKLKSVFDHIRSEKSMPLIEEVRMQPTKDLSNEVKVNKLPIICFSGEIKGTRDTKNFLKHSGLICLDFDGIAPEDVKMVKESIFTKPFVVACFTSPSGKGVKVIIRIADGEKHAEHYLALLKEFPDADKSTKDRVRACFQCADKEILVNYFAEPYSKIIENVQVMVKSGESLNSNKDFNRIEKWLEKRNNVYQSGNRNNFIFALASACCRFGIDEREAIGLITDNYLSKDTEYTVKEMTTGVSSAYKRNKFGSAEFSNDILVDRETVKEVEVDLNEEIADVLYGEDCFEDALSLYHKGYESAEPTGIPEINHLFKWKRGEVTLLSGIGNFGKSEWLKFMTLNKSAVDGTKWAFFSPENFPAHEFYHDYTETVVGANCTPKNADGTPNLDRPSEEIYTAAYNFVSEHFFYIYPKTISPTPEYIASRFLELIIKEKVDGVIIDPFNQMANDYQGRDDKYLETFLSECSRFAIKNNVYYLIVAHPHKLQKDKDTKAYPVPDVFDLAGGAMWNNKMDNIIVFHRPNHHTDVMDRTCEIHTKKIRRQKIVGMKGSIQFDYNRKKRRYVFEDCPIYRLLDSNGFKL